MAALADLIMDVRRRAGDATAPYTYTDAYYEQALDFATGKLNYDFGTTYTGPTDVATTHEWLLIKLATIELCFVRATETPTGATPDIQSITVPDLSVSHVSTQSASDVWLRLADKLQAEYDGEIDDVGTIGSVQMVRQGLRTYGKKPYALAEEPTAPTIAAAVAGTAVTLSWTPKLSTYFSSYEIYRDTAADMSTASKISTIVDNHTDEYEDEGLASGTYYYRLTYVDTDSFEPVSNIVTAVVP